MPSLADTLAGLGVTQQFSAPEAANANWRMPPGAPIKTPLGSIKAWNYEPGGGYPEGSPMYLQDILNGHLQTIDALTTSLERSTMPGTVYYDPQRADFYRRVIATTSADANAVRARLQAAQPRPMPMTGPSVVTRPGSGGLMSQEEAMQRLYQGETPPQD